MKASEMTNEELAKELLSRVPLDSNSHDDLREAAARLRALSTLTTHTDNSEVIAELERRLKVAEKFATEMKQSANSLVRACGHQMILRLRGDMEEGGNDAD